MNLHMSSLTLMRSQDLSTSALLLKEVNMAPSDVRTCVCLGFLTLTSKQAGAASVYSIIQHFQKFLNPTHNKILSLKGGAD